MVIDTKTEGDKIIVTAEGLIDTTNAPAYEKAVDEASAASSHIVLDFSGIKYISSSGLRVLLKTQKKMMATGGQLVIINANDEVKEVFNLTGFCELLNIQ